MYLKYQNFLEGHAPRSPYKVGPSGTGNSQTLTTPLDECMTLWGESERVNVQDMEQSSECV